MNAEIRLVRNDNTPWGFRLTGGKDFESPFFVVKVMQKSIAEKAGLRVGDMVWAINYQSTDPYTHKDSQRVIYESGNKVILNIRRGCPMVSGRGTPLPEYTEPLMEVDIPTPPPVYPVQPIYVPPYYPQQQLPVQPVRPLTPPKIVIENKYESTMMETMMYESTTFKSIETSKQEVTKEPEVESDLEEEEGVDVEAAWNITIKPSGRISQIEEVETPPSRPSSRASSRSRKSRSRSPSRERKKSLPKPILKVTTDVPNLVPKISTEIEETKNVTIKKTTERKHSKGSMTFAGETTEAKTSKESQTSKEVKTSTEGKTSKEVKETTERQKEIKDRTQLTDEEIAEMMSGEAEVLDHGVIGVNFQKFIPKVDFIKDSEVLQALQEEHFRKEEPEEKQLAKQPTKRFSTFLQIPKRPIPKPKPRPDNVEDLPWKRKFLSPTPTSAKQQKINDTPSQQQQHQQQPPSEEEKESAVVASASQKETSQKADVTEAMETEESEVTKVINTENVKEISSTEEEQKDKVSEVADKVKDSEAQDSAMCNGDIMETTDVNDDDDDSDERKSVRFEDEIQDNEVIEEVSSKTQALQKSIKLDLENCKDDFERQLAHIQHQLSSMQDMPEEIKTYLLEIQQQLFNVVKLKTTVEQEKAERERREQEEEEKRKAAEEEARRIAEEEEERRKAEEEEARRKAEEEANKNVQQQHTNENESQVATYNNQEGVEYAVAPPRRKEVLQTPQVRPIVLPGGRKWRRPEDAYSEEFIAETLVGMSEVLVGSTIGVNFCKYIPPKFDTSNSAVYRLIQENEARCKGIAGRPEKVLAEEDYFAPISKRHFYAAKLAEMAYANAAQQPLEPGA